MPKVKPLSTVPGFEQMTPQELFNISARHVLSNGAPSVTSKGRCKYGGIGCAAAPFLMPHRRKTLDRYDKSWPGLLEKGEVPSKHSVLVSRMQSCHDGPAEASLVNGTAEFLHAFKEGMRHLARDNHLDASVLDAKL